MYDQINKRHLEDNMALTYRQDNKTYIEKARKAEPIGTIKMMGGRECIKTANGWRAHTKSSGSKTKEHLEKNPSANHKDEHLEKFSKETPAKELQRVIKESTDPRLREHAQKELDRRKRTETSEKKMSFIDVLNDKEGKKLVEAIEDMGDNPDLVNERKSAIKELKDKFGYDYKGTPEIEADKKKKEKETWDKEQITLLARHKEEKEKANQLFQKEYGAAKSDEQAAKIFNKHSKLHDKLAKDHDTEVKAHWNKYKDEWSDGAWGKSFRENKKK